MNNDFNGQQQMYNQQPMPEYNNFNQPVKKSNTFKKTFIIIICVILAVIILGIILFTFISSNSNKLICESKEGNITLMYNDSALVGYAATGISYDLDQQQAIAEKIGIDNYIEQFKIWFENNTTGTCRVKEKE